MKNKITFSLMLKGIVQGLPLNQFEIEAAEIASQQAKVSPHLIQAEYIFVAVLTQYGVPYYKHSDLAFFFLLPLYTKD